MKHKLTKKIKNDLSDLAKLIPAVETGQTRNFVARGGLILRHKPGAKTSKDGDIEPEKFYQGDQKLLVNHKKKLYEAYEHGGPDMVNDYLKKYYPDYGNEPVTEMEVEP